MTSYYRTEDGQYDFLFSFVRTGDHIDIYCLSHPGFNGHDSSVLKTHLFDSGQICFVAGREPRDMRRAGELAKQWAEYIMQYRRTGIAQS